MLCNTFVQNLHARVEDACFVWCMFVEVTIEKRYGSLEGETFGFRDFVRLSKRLRFVLTDAHEIS